LPSTVFLHDMKFVTVRCGPGEGEKGEEREKERERKKKGKKGIEAKKAYLSSSFSS